MLTATYGLMRLVGSVVLLVGSVLTSLHYVRIASMRLVGSVVLLVGSAMTSSVLQGARHQNQFHLTPNILRGNVLCTKGSKGITVVVLLDSCCATAASQIKYLRWKVICIKIILTFLLFWAWKQ